MGMWVNTTSTANNQYLFGGWNDGPGVQFSMNVGSSTGKINLYHSSFGRINSATSVNDGKWHLVTWRYAKNGTFKIYIDGNEEASANFGTINWNSWYWIISASGSSKSNGFIGSIDDVRIYSRVLSPSEIHDLSIQ
ncbi:LamG domain-containing protein [Paenibacillus roseipurpureus]|uniref:LamG domain-containing protein n=1 Tax=Paenibacillus roseopurpureus TaxID=2918901 RepID=A0AA96RJ02_9BACL|nr:LamG domain-containing protein [Paenibacillus sp. MBLB1832]WNR42784.1 LamG domain-containing protein [Paenibacillus sp. MBLB1832]